MSTADLSALLNTTPAVRNPGPTGAAPQRPEAPVTSGIGNGMADDSAHIQQVGPSENLVSSQREYTLLDALKAAWDAMYASDPLVPEGGKDLTLNPFFLLLQQQSLMDFLSWDFGQLPPLSPGQNAFLEELRGQDIDWAVSWTRLENDLKGIDFEGERFRPELLGKKVDYAASRYAVLRDQLERTPAGPEREANLNRLERLFGAVRENIARTFAQELGGALEEYGGAGQRETVYHSVLAGFDKRLGAYTQVLDSGRDFAGLADSPDQWLKNDDAYLATRLRQAVPAPGNGRAEPRGTPRSPILEQGETPQGPATSGGRGSWAKPGPAPYTLRDLTAAGRYAAQTLPRGHPRLEATWANEESLGLDLGYKGMKTETLVQKGGLGEAMQTTLRQVFDGYAEDYANRLQEAMDRPKYIIPEDKQGFSKFRKEDVQEVYRKTVAAFRKTGDMVKSLIEGAKFGAEKFAAKQQDLSYEGVYRYSQNNNFYWEHFYRVPSATYGGYSASMSTFQRYICNWNSFMEDLAAGRPEVFEMVNPQEGWLTSDLDCLLNSTGFWKERRGGKELG